MFGSFLILGLWRHSLQMNSYSSVELRGHSIVDVRASRELLFAETDGTGLALRFLVKGGDSLNQLLKVII
jgi:hypothetical protein